MKIDNIILVLRSSIIVLSSFVIYFFCICHLESFPCTDTLDVYLYSEFIHCGIKLKQTTVESKCKLLITELSGAEQVYPLMSLTVCFCGDLVYYICRGPVTTYFVSTTYFVLPDLFCISF